MIGALFLRLPVAQQLDTAARAARERLSDRSSRQLRSAKQSVNHVDETSSLTALRVGERRVEGNAPTVQVTSGSDQGIKLVTTLGQHRKPTHLELGSGVTRR